MVFPKAADSRASLPAGFQEVYQIGQRRYKKKADWGYIAIGPIGISVVKEPKRHYNETEDNRYMKQVLVFDFGGVMAEEGFREGLKAIARADGLDEEAFFGRARDLIYKTGYVTGAGDEHAYWQAVRGEFGLTGSDEELRRQVLTRFVIRPEMFGCLADLRNRGYKAALLTDQTDWLYKLDRINNMDIRAAFDFVFNSYDLHMSKRDAGLFRYVQGRLKAAPKDILFIDDNPDNVQMAAEAGWAIVLFQDYRTFHEEMSRRLKND